MANFKPTEDELSFFKIAQNSEELSADNEMQSKFTEGLKKFGLDVLDVGKQAGRGLLQGTQELGRAFGPLQPTTFEEQKEIEQFPERLKELIPTQDSFIGGALERGGRILPTLLANPFGAQEKLGENVLRSLTSGASGETAKEFGFGELGQTIAETAPLFAPSLGRQIQPKQSQQEIVDFARSQRLTEEQIAPLLRDEGFVRDTLAKISPRGGRTQRALSSSKQGIDTAFERLSASPEAQLKLNPNQSQGFLEKLNQQLKKVPTEIRNKVKGDVSDFIESDQSLNELTNLWQDINSQFTEGQGKRLQILKEAMSGVLDEVSPQFARDFELTNDLAQRYFKVNKILKPNFISSGISLTEVGQVLHSIITGNFPALGITAGVAGARRIAREMLINPRLQNLSGKMASAVKNNSLPAAKSAFNSFKVELRRSGVDQESLDALQNLDPNTFQELIDLNMQLQKGQE